MIRNKNDYESIIREKMYDGGDIKIEHLWKNDEMKSNNRLFAKLTIQPNDFIGYHIHEDEDEIFVILKGTAETNDNGETKILNTGDTILTTGGQGHSVKCISKEPLEMLAVISCYK